MNQADRLRSMVTASKGIDADPDGILAAADELERCWERLNQTEDLLGCALAHLEGDQAYGNKAVIVGYLQAYFEARKSAHAGSER